jgi:membrane fusion protein, multidrug efflux system
MVAVVPWRVLAGDGQPAQLTIMRTIQPNAKLELHTQIGGVIEKVGFREGAPVKQGQLLIQLASPGLTAELAAAEAEFNRVEAVYQRLHAMEDKNVVSQDSLQQAQAAVEASRAHLEMKKGQLARARIVAPWDGVMGASDIQPGESVTPSTKLGV